MANQLAKDYKLKIIVYTWGVQDKVDWGLWDEKIIIRIVPYSRYFQKLIAKIFYYLWVKKDNPDSYIINFLYHGEIILPFLANIYYVLHSPASLIPHRYEYIQEKANKFNQLTFIAVSEAVKEDARPYFNKIPVNVIHHGIDLDRFNSTTHYINKEKLKLLSVSALEEWKGIQDIIKILAHVDLKHKFEYLVIGDGPYRKELEKIINELDLSSSVSIKDSVNNIESIFPNYDVYCQLSDGEAFGLSLFEAMACGLPAIVYDIPPFDSLIPSHTAKKVKNKSQTILKEYLIDLADKNERERIGNNGRNYVRENYSVEKMASNYYSLFIGCD